MKRFVFFYAFVLAILVTTVVFYTSKVDKESSKNEYNKIEEKDENIQKQEELNILKV